jgi:hypothetical protein
VEDFPSDSLFLVWCLLTLACIVGVAMAIRAEGRWFTENGKRRSWLLLRICSIPIAISTFGLVILLARTIGGPEVLGVLYALLFTAAPVAYFGQHWIAGRWLTPRLSGGESAWIAFSGLLIVVAPPALISALNPWAHDAAVFLDILF